MKTIPLEVILTEVIPIEDIPLEERPPIKFEMLKNGRTLTTKISQGLIGSFFTLENGNTELYLKGKEKPVVVKGSAQEIITKFFEKNKKQYRQIRETETIKVNMPEQLIGSLQPIYVQIDGKYEEATKLFRRDSDEFIIVTGTIVENMKKICPKILA